MFIHLHIWEQDFDSLKHCLGYRRYAERRLPILFPNHVVRVLDHGATDIRCAEVMTDDHDNFESIIKTIKQVRDCYFHQPTLTDLWNAYSRTLTFRTEVFDNTRRWGRLTWDCKTHGRPTDKNAEKFRVSLNKSYALGGCNYPISQSYGFIIHASKVRVIRQSTGEIVAKADAPTFEIV